MPDAVPITATPAANDSACVVAIGATSMKCSSCVANTPSTTSTSKALSTRT
jgi:hypothetical protein